MDHCFNYIASKGIGFVMHCLTRKAKKCVGLKMSYEVLMNHLRSRHNTVALCN